MSKSRQRRSICWLALGLAQQFKGEAKIPQTPSLSLAKTETTLRDPGRQIWKNYRSQNRRNLKSAAAKNFLHPNKSPVFLSRSVNILIRMVVLVLALRAKGTLISEPRFSTPCEMRFFPREKGKTAFQRESLDKRPLSLSRVGKSHLAGGRKSGLAN